MLVLERDLDGRGRTLKVDVPLVTQYVEALRGLQRALALPGEVTIDAVAAQRDLIAVEESSESVEETWGELLPALTAALDALGEMRQREGEALRAILATHLEEVGATLAGIVARAPELVRLQRDRLRQRVAELLDGRLPDAVRLEQEVALLADRSDVTEECDRLRSHLTQFRATLEQSGPQGRRLDFLLQEMHREANTIGSKSTDAALAHEVVELKTSLERLREQVQNLE